ncbi:MAG: M56 family metallopeptidase [Actinobacteria bacterium]|nr:M56 family metallopeptidase [Actinomycetota bacterium]
MLIAVLLGGAFVFLLAAPKLARRFLEPVAGVRSLVWLNLGWLIASGMVMASTLIVLLLRFMPRAIMQAFGITCTDRGKCVALVPLWGQWALFAGALAVFALFIVVALYSAGSGILAMVRARRAALSAGRPVPGWSSDGRLPYEPLVVLDVPGTFAFTVGLRRPVIVLSNNLISSLAPQQLEAVVAHERAHATGRDNIILLMASVLAGSLWFLPGVRTAHRRLRRALELAADDRARRDLGDGLVVAGSLHRFASLMAPRTVDKRRPRSPVLAWFAEDGLIVERIGWLLEESERPVSRYRIRLALVVLVTVTLALGWAAYQVGGVNLDLGAHSPGCAGSAACHVPES